MSHHLLRALAPHMIVGLGGPRLLEEERKLLAEYPFSGVILFDRNVADARQLVELTREIKAIFREMHHSVPIIAADHEGGIVSYLGRAIGVPPTQMAVSRTGDPRLCGRLFAENARRMRACGVNMLLGPVADVNSEELNPVIGTRSFGEEVGPVASLVFAAVSAARKGGVLACIKHFPGHGSSSVDSHLALPVLGATLEQLRQRDIPPFSSGIRAGVETVMAGHIAPLGRSLPASLDPEMIEGLLRGELGFGGVVMTDALEMEGVKVAGLADICRRALEAGNDILLFSKPVVAAAGELEALGDLPALDASRAGGLAGVLESSGARIASLLQSAAKGDREFELPADAAVYEEIARRSIESRGVPPGAPPLGADGRMRVFFYSDRGAFDRYPVRSFVERILRGLRVEGPASWSESAKSAVGASDWLDRSGLAPHANVPGASNGLESFLCERGGKGEPSQDIIVLLNRGPIEASSVIEICAKARAVVVAGWPYASRLVPSGIAVYVTYGIYDAAAEVLCGRLLQPSAAR